MKKIKVQAIAGLGVSEWWDVEGDTILVKTLDGKSIIHVTTKAKLQTTIQRLGVPEHWSATQSIDVTEKVAAIALVTNEGLADLVSSGITLTKDQALRKHIECSAKDVSLVLSKIESALLSSNF
jgi:hypothetical protein